MAQSTEATVGLTPSSTGSKVRVLQITTLVDGVMTTVQMQVIAIADERGRVLLARDHEMLVDLVTLQTRTNELLEELIAKF